jgi:histidinol phosphatase-like enzyme
MSRPGVFLDFNGTLVEPLKQKRFDELTLIRGVAEAVARLIAAGFVCPVVTVQSGDVHLNRRRVSDAQVVCLGSATDIDA